MSDQPYRTVLVGTDGSESSFRAVDRAAVIARDAGATLLLATAYRPMSGRETQAAQDVLGGESYKVAGSTPAEDVLRDACDRATALGVERTETVPIEGDPVDALVDLVRERKVDLLVVGNRGLNSLAGRLLGSVPANISHRAQCDVLIVHTTGRGAKVAVVRPLGVRPPVAGGLDVDLPGVEVRLRATRWPGEGLPVLLLHGLASTRRFWDLVVPELGGAPVLALDQRGHGDSDRPDGPYDGATVVQDALTALDAVGLSRVVVVGHSWGASTALRLAAEAPERVLAVVAVDGGTGAPRVSGDDRAAARERLTPPRTAVAPEELPAMLRRGPLGPWWSPEVEAAILPIFAVHDDGLARPRLPFQAHMAIVDDLLDGDLTALLPRITCPAWLVSCRSGGAEAPFAAEREAALQRATSLLARPRVLRWEGALHDVPLQWPALVAGLIRAAAQEAAAGPAGEGETA